MNEQIAQEMRFRKSDALAGLTYDEISPLDLDSWSFVILEARIEIQKHPKKAQKCKVMCFQGCDASLLLNSSSSTDQEKDSFPNLTIHGVDVIELAKLKLESVCRGVVSCADIIALATRDAVALVCMFTPIQPKTVTFKC